MSALALAKRPCSMLEHTFFFDCSDGFGVFRSARIKTYARHVPSLLEPMRLTRACSSPSAMMTTVLRALHSSAQSANYCEVCFWNSRSEDSRRRRQLASWTPSDNIFSIAVTHLVLAVSASGLLFEEVHRRPQGSEIEYITISQDQPPDTHRIAQGGA